MTEIPFSGDLHRSGNLCQKKNRYYYTSNLQINTEWNLVCLWPEEAPSIPECLEISRNSTAKEVLVSGTFKLMQGGSYLLERKFAQLIEVGFRTTRIELEYSNSNTSLLVSTNRRLILQQLQPGLSYNGIYSITGTLNISAYTPVDKGNAKGVQFKSLLNLSNDFECLLDPKSTYFSDVIVSCGTVSFSAHKNILSARSPVFAAMFSNQMKESRDNKVNITDLSPQVLKTMLTYIYTGKTGELSVQSAGELLFAADKYELQDLKRVCSDYLKSCASVENVLKTLVLGYLHDEDLKGFAIDFICNSCEEFEVLEKTVEWKNLREKIPTLAMDVLTGMVKSKDQKLKRQK